MTTAALIQRLTNTGIRLSAEGDRLHVEAPLGAITSELRDLLANRKADLIEAMSGIRGHLLVLAKSEGLDASLVHNLSSADVDACAGLSDAQQYAYLSMLDDTATREASKRPASYTTKAMCRHCGPVWLPLGVSQAGNLPQVPGCPWCHVRAAGGLIPRPPVTCHSCRFFRRDPVNPKGGMGHCTTDAARPEDPPTYPCTTRRCGSWRPTGDDHDAS